MKYTRLLLLSFVLLSLFAVLPVASSAQEQYVRRYNFTTAICSDDMPGGSLFSVFSTAYNLLAGATVERTTYVNGVVYDYYQNTVLTDVNGGFPFVGDGVQSPSFPFTVQYIATVTYNGEQVFSQTTTLECTVDGGTANITISYNIHGSAHGGFRDGRVNRDPDQSATVYCRENGIDLYYGEIGKPNHLFVSQEQIDAVPANPTQHTLIATDGTIYLYRLVGGWFQINTPYHDGRTYIVLWDDCPATRWDSDVFPQ